MWHTPFAQTYSHSPTHVHTHTSPLKVCRCQQWKCNSAGSCYLTPTLVHLRIILLMNIKGAASTATLPGDNFELLLSVTCIIATKSTFTLMLLAEQACNFIIRFVIQSVTIIASPEMIKYPLVSLNRWIHEYRAINSHLNCYPTCQSEPLFLQQTYTQSIQH